MLPDRKAHTVPTWLSEHPGCQGGVPGFLRHLRPSRPSRAVRSGSGSEPLAPTAASPTGPRRRRHSTPRRDRRAHWLSVHDVYAVRAGSSHGHHAAHVVEMVRAHRRPVLREAPLAQECPGAYSTKVGRRRNGRWPPTLPILPATFEAAGLPGRREGVQQSSGIGRACTAMSCRRFVVGNDHSTTGSYEMLLTCELTGW